LKDDKAYTKYQGQEYQKMLIEELSQIARETDYNKLIGSCRSTVDGIKPQIFCTTNPDEPGLEWIKNHWGIPDVPDFDKVYEKIDAQGRRLVFVPAKVEDNPILLTKDPNYLKYLESFKVSDPDLYEAWRMGNWKGYGVEGAYYRQQLTLAESEKRITNVPYEESIRGGTWA
jgi:phage terminase large subunit